jgi:hypothetical protein
MDAVDERDGSQDFAEVVIDGWDPSSTSSLRPLGVLVAQNQHIEKTAADETETELSEDWKREPLRCRGEGEKRERQLGGCAARAVRQSIAINCWCERTRFWARLPGTALRGSGRARHSSRLPVGSPFSQTGNGVDAKVWSSGGVERRQTGNL